ALDLCEKRFENNDVSNITFDELASISSIPDYQITMLKDIYQTADDIDLLVGAILEEPAVGSLFGSTITCLLSE
uniref:Uncharacterized protein n=1 Tax=Megaselia scalaris TaxID=36166 RepID=T1GFJ4_MEGSC